MAGLNTDNKLFNCTLCTFAAKRIDTLTVHIRTHTGEKPFKCQHPHCPFKTNYKSSLETHSTLHLVAKPFACDLCPYRSKLKQSLKAHQRAVHSTEKPFKCPQPNCTVSCKFRGQLKKHMSIHSGQNNFNCPLCTTYSTHRKSYLNSHMRTHTREKPYKCGYENCSYASSVRSIVNNHEIAVHRKDDESLPTIQCPFSGCEYKANIKTNLNRHLKQRHSKAKPFACELCSFRSKRKEGVKRHYAHVHSTEKPFKCVELNCSFASKQKGHLIAHLRIHSGERPFPCSFPGCTYKARWSGHLRVHQRSHSEETPFLCSLCPFSCKQKMSLDLHTRGHTGETPYPCQNCSFQGKSGDEVVRHLKKKKCGVPREIFECTVVTCDYSTTEGPSLALHLSTAHSLPRVVLLMRFDGVSGFHGA